MSGAAEYEDGLLPGEPGDLKVKEQLTNSITGEIYLREVCPDPVWDRLSVPLRRDTRGEVLSGPPALVAEHLGHKIGESAKGARRVPGPASGHRAGP